MSHVKTSWKHIRRSPYQALAAIFIMMLTFLTISVFAFIVFGSTAIIKYFESKPQVTAFFKEEAKQQDIEGLEADLKQTGKVAEVKFISKKEALEDVLPASLEISTYKIDDLAPISDTLKNSQYVSEVVYQKDVISTLSTWTNAVRLTGITLITILSLVSVFIIMTIIGFKVSQKKEEIEIMRLLSATNWYIRWPFILEGIFYGGLGTLFGWIIASAGLLYATPYLDTFLKGIPLLPVSPLFLLELLAGELLIAVLLGMVASSLAVLRYLK